MKLKYEKPSMVIEKFEMCQHIAYGCTVEQLEETPTTRTSHDCAWQNPGDYAWLWQGDNSSCDLVPDETYNDLCYNGPESGIVPFAS